MNGSIFLSCLLLVNLGSIINARSADEWKSRVIYQILTDRFARSNDSSSGCSDLSNYCGGTFRGIVNKLDYIQGLGANAIWISPIPDNTDGGYHGYWQKNITLINSHYGSPDDLKALVNACHQRDIWVMLDVVGNHMGNQDNGDWNNFDKFFPFNHQEHYHPYCQINDFDDQHQVEVCRLANLPDLDQSNSFVRSTLKNWVKSTVSTYGFDGIRIDTTPEVPKDFWSEYTQSAGVFSIGEVDNGNPDYNAGYQGPEDATLNYPMYFKLKDAFQSGKSMKNIHDGVTQNQVFKDVSVLGNFLDNHDNPRFLSQNGNYNILKNALAYIILAEGIPIVYYGTEQGYKGDGDPRNRESLWPNYNTNSDLYQFIATLAKFRTQRGRDFWESKQVERYVDDQFFAFTRGNVFVATSNAGNLQRTITYHPYNDGTVLQNILDPSDKVTVNNKQFNVNLGNLPKVYIPANSDGTDNELIQPLSDIIIKNTPVTDQSNTPSESGYCANLGCSIVAGFKLLVLLVVITVGYYYWRRVLRPSA